MTENIDQKLKALVVQEKEARERRITLLRALDRRKIWEQEGFKSFKEYCIKKFRYDENEIRDILIALGHIVTTDQMVDDNPRVQKRIEALKIWRRERARKESVSAYLILSNRTLMDIARDNPKDKEALSGITGMGDIKVKTFGQQILNCL